MRGDSDGGIEASHFCFEARRTVNSLGGELMFLRQGRNSPGDAATASPLASLQRKQAFIDASLDSDPSP